MAPLVFILQELPINVKFCFEGMEESGSEGLDELVLARKDTFFKDVDYVCISDNYWLGKTKPCITYGLRGICYFFIEVMIERFNNSVKLQQAIKTSCQTPQFAPSTQVLNLSFFFLYTFKGGIWMQRPALWGVWWICLRRHDRLDHTYG